MIYDAEEFNRLRKVVISISLTSWLVILFKPVTSSCCAAVTTAWLLDLRCNLNLLGSLASDWVLMLLAMMGPTLVPAIYHVRISSFARRRLRSTVLFIGSYGVIWLAAGAILLSAQRCSMWLEPQSNLPAISVGVVALLWQVSPIKQRCLNRCHSHRPLAAFGFGADRDVIHMGFEHGLWCAGSCWAAMLFPLLLSQGHLLTMAAITVLMFCERLDPPKAPSWRWRGFHTAFCYIRLRLRDVYSVRPRFAFTTQA